jgi:hypothetical protein
MLDCRYSISGANPDRVDHFGGEEMAKSARKKADARFGIAQIIDAAACDRLGIPVAAAGVICRGAFFGTVTLMERRLLRLNLGVREMAISAP